MAGRPRRLRASSTSTSTSSSSSNAAPVNSTRTRWMKESAVLLPRPEDVPDDDWPGYVLNDATVYRKDGKTPANPLLLSLEGNLVVRGQLEVDDPDCIANVLRPGLENAFLEIIPDRYSIGDGPITLWVAGASGWFEIRPSATFQAMYNQVREATVVYYCAFMAYEEYNQACVGKKKARRPPPPTFDDIYFKYAVRTGDGILRHEAEALYKKWAPFMVSHFDLEKELKWNGTHFAESLRAAHPHIVKRMTDIANGLVPAPLPPALLEIQSPEENKTAAPERRGTLSVRTNPSHRSIQPPKPKMTESPVPLPEKYRQITQPRPSLPPSTETPKETPKGTPKEPSVANAGSESPVDRLLAALQEIAAETDLQKSPSTIYSKVYFKIKITHYGDAKLVISYYAKDLLARLGAEWKDVPFYNWLRDAAARPWTPSETLKAEDVPSQTIRRMKSVPKQASLAKPATQLPPNISLKGRPRTVISVDSDGDSDEHDAPPMRGRRSGKNAGLRLISTSQKRPHPEPDQANGGHRGRKSAKFSHPASEDDDQPDDTEDTNDEDLGGEPAVGSRLPLPEGAVRVVLHAERIPTSSPSGPDGTWTCDQEGCAYVVRSAREQEAQELIQAHFRDHTAQAEKINLAVKESRGHMPINHLLSKIQALGKAALFGKQETINGEPVPKPVKRRLLV